MNKNLLDIGVKTIFATAIILLGIGHWQNNTAVVYVDSQRLMVGYKGMQAAKRELESKVALWKSNLDTLQSELESAVRDYELKKIKLTQNERKLTEELLSGKQQQFINYKQVIDEKIQNEDQEITRRVLEKMNASIKKYGEEKGYKIIVAATQYGNIVYAEDELDVTDDILKLLNAEFK